MSSTPESPEGFKALIIDIENIPNKVWAWGLWDQSIPIGMIEEPARMVCFAAKWLGAPKKSTEFYSEWQPGGRPDMLENAWRLMDEADAIIGYNSRGFDVKHLYAELAVDGHGPPSPHHNIDLLTEVKRNFRFPSNKLDYISQRFDLGAKTQHSGWALWQGVIDGDPKARRLMEKYNIQDVTLTEKLHDRLLPWLKYPNIALYGDGEVGCRKCGENNFQKRGTVATATGVYQRVLCLDCGTWSRYAAKEPEISTPYRAL